MAPGRLTVEGGREREGGVLLSGLGQWYFSNSVGKSTDRLPAQVPQVL